MLCRAGRGRGSCASPASARCQATASRRGRRSAFRRRRARRRAQPPAAEARPPDRGRRAVRPRHGDLPGSRMPSCSTNRRVSRRRAGRRRTSISTACSTALAMSAAGPSSSTGSTRTRRGRCWSRGLARAAGHFAKAFSGRTAKKVYWAIVVGVPDARRGHHRRAACQAAGHRRRENARQRRARAYGEDALAADRSRRQSRRLGRASATDRPNAPAARAHGVDRASDRGRREIWRAGGVPDRWRSAASCTFMLGASGSTLPTAARST